MNNVSAQLERQRLENLKLANESIRCCHARVFVHGYIPGHIWYNLNEYPTDRFIEPGDLDEKLFAEYAAAGVGLLKVHEEWNDSMEMYGADKFSPYDPEGWRTFSQMVHRRRLKLIPYVSSGYLDQRSKHFHSEWAATDNSLDALYFRYGYMSPRSPDWRAFFLERLDEMFTRDAIDGIYNDMGFYKKGFYPYYKMGIYPVETREPLRAGQVDAFPDESEFCGALEDFLGEIHALVKRHHGLVINHFGGARKPPCREKFYDYLCVGEGVKGLAQMREKVTGWEPFTMVIPDWTQLPEGEESVLYASCIPYLLFPVLCDGRSVTGERVACPQAQYQEDEHWFIHMKRIAEFRRENAPPTFGYWDAVPGRPSTKPRWYHFLKLYRLMTKDGTHACLEITEATFLGDGLPKNVVCSAFVNDEFYLAIANYGSATAPLKLTFDVQDLESGERARMIELAPQSMRLLRKL